MYNVLLSSPALRTLKTLKSRYKEKVSQAIGEIREVPFSGKPLDRDLVNHYSWRVGVYRIVYKVNKKDRKIVVKSIGHRATVYN